MEPHLQGDPMMKKIRKANWTEDETLNLLALVKKRRAVLRMSSPRTITSDMKWQVWGEIARLLNASHPSVTRTRLECKKRWYTILTKARGKDNEYKSGVVGTGEGPATPKFDVINQAVSDILSDGNMTVQRYPEGTNSTLYHSQLKGDRSKWDHIKKEHELHDTVDESTPVSDPYVAVTRTPVSDPNKVVTRTPVSDPNKVVTRTPVSDPNKVVTRTPVSDPNKMVTRSPISDPNKVVTRTPISDLNERITRTPISGLNEVVTSMLGTEMDEPQSSQTPQSLHHELRRKQSALIDAQLENEVIKKKVLLAQLEEAQARVRLAELEVTMLQKREELN